MRKRCHLQVFCLLIKTTLSELVLQKTMMTNKINIQNRPDLIGHNIIMIKHIQHAHKKPQCVAGKASKDAKYNKVATSCVACLQQKKCCKKNVINHAMQDSMEKSTIKLFNHVRNYIKY